MINDVYSVFIENFEVKHDAYYVINVKIIGIFTGILLENACLKIKEGDKILLTIIEFDRSDVFFWKGMTFLKMLPGIKYSLEFERCYNMIITEKLSNISIKMLDNYQ
jgi:hypothetical protein